MVLEKSHRIAQTHYLGNSSRSKSMLPQREVGQVSLRTTATDSLLMLPHIHSTSSVGIFAVNNLGYPPSHFKPSHRSRLIDGFHH